MAGMRAYINCEKTACACMSVEGSCLDRVVDRMMMGADQSPKVFFKVGGADWLTVGRP